MKRKRLNWAQANLFEKDNRKDFELDTLSIDSTLQVFIESPWVSIVFEMCLW